jgi:hypothetical protein
MYYSKFCGSQDQNKCVKIFSTAPDLYQRLTAPASQYLDFHGQALRVPK